MLRSIRRQKRYVAVDVETTGLSPWKGDRVIEIGAVALEGGAPNVSATKRGNGP